MPIAPGMAAQEANNAGAASAFEANVIPMMTILQFLFFALAPLVAVVIAFMGAQGAGIYMKYVMFGIWTQSWLPVVAIINDYAQYISQNSFTNMISATTPGSTNPAVLTHFVLMPQVFSAAQLALSNANMMVSMTPILTLAILTGSFMAMTQMGKMMGSESTMAASGKVATPTMGATTFNSAVTGHAAMSDGTGTISQDNAMMQHVGSMSTGTALSQGHSAAMQSSLANTSSAVSASERGVQALASQDFQNGDFQQLQNTDGWKDATQFQQQRSQLISNLTKAGVSHAASEADKIIGTAAGGGSLGPIKASLQAQMEKSNTNQSQVSQEASAAINLGVTASKTMDNFNGLSGSWGSKSAQMHAFKEAMGQSQKHQDAAKEDAAKAASYQSQESAIQSAGFGTNWTPAAIQKMASEMHKNQDLVGANIQSRMAGLSGASGDEAKTAFNRSMAMLEKGGMAASNPETAITAAIMAGNAGISPLAKADIASAVSSSLGLGTDTSAAAAPGQIATATAAVNAGSTALTNAVSRITGSPNAADAAPVLPYGGPASSAGAANAAAQQAESQANPNVAPQVHPELPVAPGPVAGTPPPPGNPGLPGLGAGQVIAGIAGYGLWEGSQYFKNIPKPTGVPGDSTPPAPEATTPYKPASGFNQYGGQSTESLVDNAVNERVAAGESPLIRAAVNALPKTPARTIEDILDFEKDTGLPEA
ncbi:conjugal transfer protein TraG [Acidithiobacillus ferrivorans]|nr:conjugal transfer protein TraG [Acidithiobacillus ferrivorans]